jgi:hypothetical protein
MTIFFALLLLLSVDGVKAQTSSFSYEGTLSESGSPANGDYDFEFKLFDDISTGQQQGSTLQRLNVTVKNGDYLVTLDYGALVFRGDDFFLETSYRATGGGAFTVITPRQQILSVPYAIKSLNAATAEGLSGACVNCVTSNQIGSVDGGAVTGAIPLASLPAGSGYYIQNSNSQQTSANFNISGTGTAWILDAAQYNIGGNRVLGIGGAGNTFAGLNAGTSNTGTANSFFGSSAGRSNTTGFDNSYFGNLAGITNTSGFGNSFVGSAAGHSNSTGSSNSFFGSFAGFSNSTASYNSFFGYAAGNSSTGSSNSFFGSGAGFSNTTGNRNAFFGRNAGISNTEGSHNAFFGYNAGNSNSSSQSNAFFGSESGHSNTTGGYNSFFGFQAGYDNTSGQGNAFFGKDAGRSNTMGGDNAFFGYHAGNQNTTGTFNTFFGAFAGNSNATGNFNTIIGQHADVTASNLNFATAIGGGATVSASNTVVLGRSSDTVRVPGNFVVLTLGSAGSTSLCRNTANQIATCSSSLRYKTEVRPYYGGLDIISRLRPITFDWKSGGKSDLGFGAEEVERVEPLLVTHNDKGEIEGVKYAQITTVLVNAVREQQAQIDSLKKIVCLDHPDRDFCKPE